MKQCHEFTLIFPIVFENDQETDYDMIDMAILIASAEKQLRKIKRKPYNYLESFDHVQTYNQD